jgi:hypothetical protein
VRQRAERLASVHALSAADALQLAAALVVSREHPETLEYVTLDKVLARAARLEGFTVIGVRQALSSVQSSKFKVQSGGVDHPAGQEPRPF